jgi:hypothetical protein
MNGTGLWVAEVMRVAMVLVSMMAESRVEG